MTSQFTQTLINQPPKFDFVAAHFECEQNLYTPDNPDGFVNFGSAQNFLHPQATKDLMAGFACHPEDAHYQPFGGSESCRLAVAEYLQGLSQPPADANDNAAELRVDPDHILIGNGVISLLEALAVALLDEGDSVLVPTPVFPGLVNAMSLRVRSGVEFLHTRPEDEFRMTPAMLSQALLQHKSSGSRVRAVLLCSPGNPIGQVFSAFEVHEFAAIAAEFDCALIVDEVYAGSCFTPDAFHSAVELKSPNVYVLGGLSKDFGLAGFATGWLHVPNDDVRQAVAKQSHFFRLPAPVQRMMERTLVPVWQQGYLRRHREVLKKRYELAVEALRDTGIATTRSEAGLCLWLDLREHLATPDAAGELELYQRLLMENRVHVSPGTGFFTPDTGFFRICFSHDESTLLEGLRRLAAGLHLHRNSLPGISQRGLAKERS